jgi:uncharacterized protein
MLRDRLSATQHVRRHRRPALVLVEARYRATAKATGKPLDAQVAHVWDFRDGKVVRFQQYTDTWQFSEVTGIKPKS